MIAIVDYNAGNLRSVQKAFEKIGMKAIITNNKKDISTADLIVLPGVGSFNDGMKNLKKLGLLEALADEVIWKKKPFLGICLGMQLICKIGYEDGITNGLGWIDAEVKRFDFLNIDNNIKIPHVGWNSVAFLEEESLFQDIGNLSDFYFVHSYHIANLQDGRCIGTTSHGYDFVSAIKKDNIVAFQFHPEKSQEVGLKLLKNVVEYAKN